MAVVDSEFREWIAEFKKANPSATQRAILDTAQFAFAAGRAAQREHDAALRAAPEGWSFQQQEDGSIVVTAEHYGAVHVRPDDSDSIAAAGLRTERTQ